MNVIRTIEWVDGRVLLIDQTALPLEGRIIECRTADEIAAAITGMAIRGAPAIGVAAAFGLALWAQESSAADAGEFLDGLDEAAAMLAATRPTAKNLTWALDRMTGLARANREASTSELRQLLIDEAIEIADEDLERNQAIGLAGEHLIGDDARVLTHCNAGSLATAGYGTALAPIFAAHSMGRALSVWAGETRPLLQGARLTAWELVRAGIPVTVVTDNMVGRLMQEGLVDIVLVGADRIAANGDVANKIGTYPIAVLAARHGVPFYVCAPTSTIDLDTAGGSAIPIEERDPDEVLFIAGRRVAPEGVPAYNPAFDVTPAELVGGIVTERGIVRPPYDAGLAAVCSAETEAEDEHEAENEHEAETEAKDEHEAEH